MTRDELATWCVNVTDKQEMPTITPSSLEAAKASYDRRERLLEEIQQANRELAENIRKARQTHSLAVIASELGVSRQRVHQISQEKS